MGPKHTDPLTFPWAVQQNLKGSRRAPGVSVRSLKISIRAPPVQTGPFRFKCRFFGGSNFQPARTSALKARLSEFVAVRGAFCAQHESFARPGPVRQFHTLIQHLTCPRDIQPTHAVDETSAPPTAEAGNARRHLLERREASNSNGRSVGWQLTPAGGPS